LTMDGHTVLNTTNGQEAVEMIQVDRAFDCILMVSGHGIIRFLPKHMLRKMFAGHSNASEERV